MRGSLERARSELAERLRERRGEIEEALLTRTYAIADPKEAADPEYAEGLRAAVSAAHSYALEAIAEGEERAPHLPAVLLTQARIAARSGVPLDTVLRRYFAGYTLLGDFLMQEAENEGRLGDQALKHLFRALSSLFDRLITAVTEEYAREGEARIASTEQRRIERVERLLAGELADASELGYDFDGWNLGAIASGPDAPQALQELSKAEDCRLLLVRCEEDVAWAWFGSRSPLDPGGLVRAAFSIESAPAAMALGESGEGLSGWRLTHRQAGAALAIAQRRSKTIARYIDVALLASVLQDDLLATSLRQLFIEPLSRDRSEGEVALETLRAYFATERNAASAAVVLGVSPQAISRRLRSIEGRLGRSLGTCAAALELALNIRDFRDVPESPSSAPSAGDRPL